MNIQTIIEFLSTMDKTDTSYYELYILLMEEIF
jgi:hypothetical protein